MKLHYYPETDSLYIELKDTPGAETREIVRGLLVDRELFCLFDGRGTGLVSFTSCCCTGIAGRLPVYAASERCGRPTEQPPVRGWNSLSDPITELEMGLWCKDLRWAWQSLSAGEKSLSEAG